jgi:hypothetical protein
MNNLQKMIKVNFYFSLFLIQIFYGHRFFSILIENFVFLKPLNYFPLKTRNLIQLNIFLQNELRFLKMVLRTINNKMPFLITRKTLFIHKLKILINIDALLSPEENLKVMREILLNHVQKSRFLEVDYRSEITN